MIFTYDKEKHVYTTTIKARRGNLTAIIDTGASYSLITFDSWKQLFNITEENAKIAWDNAQNAKKHTVSTANGKIEAVIIYEKRVLLSSNYFDTFYMLLSLSESINTVPHILIGLDVLRFCKEFRGNKREIELIDFDNKGYADEHKEIDGGGICLNVVLENSK